MKISKVILAALTATVVVSSCTKDHKVTPTPNQQNNSVEKPDNSNECPACGMG